MPLPASESVGPNPTLRNVNAIALLEHDALTRRTLSEKFSSAVTKTIGTPIFIVLQVFIVALWILFNLHPPSRMVAFDPFPFGLLAMLVSAEGVFFTLFVLLSQNAIIRQADRRSHLDLQIGMLTEQELTTVLQMLQKLCRHAGVDVRNSEKTVADFSKATDVHALASELEDKLPDV